MEHYDVVVVGAGVWGLCAAHTFLTVDPAISVLIVDSKNTVGGVWATEQLYPGLRANNLQGYYEFSDFPMLEAGLDIQPRGLLSGEKIYAYLRKYAERFDLVRRLRLGTKVLRAVETGDDEGWELELQDVNDDGAVGHISCAKLVVATGQASTPNKPSFDGLESFTKPVVHSVDLGKAAPSLMSDERIHEVAVVGGSKSAHDAVYLFATAGKHVTWLIHESSHGRGAMPMGKPYTQMGRWSVWVEGLLMTRPLSWFAAAPWSDGDGFGWIRWLLHRTKLGNRIVKGYFAGLTNDSLRQSGIFDSDETKALAPAETLLWYGAQAATLNYDQDFYQLIREDKVTVIRGNIRHLDADSVHLDSRTVRTDALICAIGYDYSASVPLEPASRRLSWGCPVNPSQDTTYPDLDARADEELLSRFPILHTSPTKPERLPGLTPWRLWRFIAPPSQVPRVSGGGDGGRRNLAFLNIIASYQTTIKAELTSLWAYAYLHDKLKDPAPSEREAMYEAALWSRFGKWRAPYGMQGKSADFLLDAMPYYDLLLRDLGLRSWRKGWGLVGEVFGGWYEVGDYKGVVGEWMRARGRVTAGERKDK